MRIQVNNRLIADKGLLDTAPGDQSFLISDFADSTIPAYMREVYNSAYANPTTARFLDHDAKVSAILLGNSARLRRALISETLTDQRVLQVAHVYG